jgi:phage gp29-like protein
MVSNKLVDINGNALPWPSESDVQTDEAKLGHLRQHFAEHPSSGLKPSRLAEIMRSAERGDLIAQADLGEDIEEKDGHVFSELQKRKLSLLTITGSVEPCRNASESEKKDAALVQELVDEIPDFEDIITDMADAILKGYSNIELEWTRWGNYWLISRAHYRPQNWFQTHPDNRNEIRLRDNSIDGEALRPLNWIRHIHKSKSGYPGRNGLTRVLAWPFLFKNYSVRDLAEFLEIYGLPLRLGKYPAGASDKEKSTLLNAVMSIGHNAGGIIPKGMEIEFQEAAKGSSSPYESMMAWCERTQSKAILGGTLTSQADGKSSTNALGNVHNEVRQELRDSDLRQIASTLTRDLIYPLWLLNGRAAGDPRRHPKFVFDTSEPEDISTYSQHLPSLVSLGMRIPQSWAHEKLMIPEAEKDEPILGLVQVQPSASADQPEDAQAAKLAALKAQEQQEVVDAYVNQLQGTANAASTEMINAIKQLVESAASLEEIREGLLTLNLPVDKLADAMNEAMAAASLAGRYELLQDAE